ncbi:MAG: methyltransferase domain-containing protein [Pseudomonadota bacterium]
MERAGWSDPETAASYASDFAYAAEQSVETLLDAANVAAGMRVLDVCCGHGIVSRRAVQRGAHATGVDFSPAMIRMARENAPTAEFIEGDALDLPFDDASADAVVMGFGILHVPDAEAAAVEAARVLKPGGCFAYSCWHGAERASALPAVFEAIAAHGDPRITLPPAKPAPYYAQRENAEAMLVQAGFADICIDSVESHWLCSAPDDPLRFFAEGTVRGAGLLRAQPAAHHHAIRRAVIDWVHATGSRDAVSGKTRVPLPAAVVSAQKANVP